MVNKLSRLFTHRLSRRTPLQRPRLSSLPRTGVNCGFRVALGTPHWTPPTDHSMTSALFQPIQLRGLALENRVMVSPMCQYSAIDGCMTDWHFAHLGMLANSGAALLCFEMTDVEPIGRITPGCSGLYSDANEAALRRIVAFCRAHGQANLDRRALGREKIARPGGRRLAAGRPFRSRDGRRRAGTARAHPRRDQGTRREIRRFDAPRRANRVRCDRVAFGSRLSHARISVAALEPA